LISTISTTIHPTTTTTTTTFSTGTSTSIVVTVTTETDTTTVETDTTTPLIKRTASSTIPSYASACSNVSQYSSACSCFGIHPSTTTKTVTTTKTTKELTSTSSVTVTSISISATSTTTTTTTTTVTTSTESVTATATCNTFGLQAQDGILGTSHIQVRSGFLVAYHNGIDQAIGFADLFYLDSLDHLIVAASGNIIVRPGTGDPGFLMAADPSSIPDGYTAITCENTAGLLTCQNGLNTVFEYTYDQSNPNFYLSLDSSVQSNSIQTSVTAVRDCVFPP
jgi:hypothetical protein